MKIFSYSFSSSSFSVHDLPLGIMNKPLGFFFFSCWLTPWCFKKKKIPQGLKKIILKKSYFSPTQILYKHLQLKIETLCLPVGPVEPIVKRFWNPSNFLFSPQDAWHCLLLRRILITRQLGNRAGQSSRLLHGT